LDLPTFARWLTSNSLPLCKTLKVSPEGVKRQFLRLFEENRRFLAGENFLQFGRRHFILRAMTQPLALVVYEKLLPGSQLVNRLQDLKYRVQTLTDAESLVACAGQDKPMLVVVDLISARNNVIEVIGRLKQAPDTRHIPVIGYAPDDAAELHQAARQAGATLVVSETAIVNHLPQFLDQALQVE
jgi:CheY-like chemotaxis protein